MIQVFAHRRDGRFVASACPSRADSLLPLLEEFDPAAPAQDDLLSWVDIEDPSPEELAWLGRRFHFHPLALEDCAHFDQRPKLEEYAEHLFLVVQGLRYDLKGEELEVYELHCFVTASTLVTVHAGRIETIEGFKRVIVRDRQRLPLQVDFALHRVLDAAMDGNPVALEPIEERIDLIEDEILQKTNASQIERIHGLQREIARARSMAIPQRDVYRKLAGEGVPFVSEQSAAYFRDLDDHALRLGERLERLREQLWQTRDAFVAMSSYYANEAMRRLTVFSALFLPLTFVTGFFGMNFDSVIPWKNEALAYAVAASTLLLPGAMLYWFRRKRWLG